MRILASWSNNMPKPLATTYIITRAFCMTGSKWLFLESMHSFLDKNSVNERAPFPRVYVSVVASLGRTNNNILACIFGRHGGLMVSALDSGSGGPGLSPGRGTALCSWARYFTLILPLSTKVYKWVPANLLLGVTLRWTSIPSRGE